MLEETESGTISPATSAAGTPASARPRITYRSRRSLPQIVPLSGYNLLVTTLQDVVTATGGTSLNQWDPLVIWSASHGLAMLRLEAALRSLSAQQFTQARDRVLLTIVSAVPLDALDHSEPVEAAGDRRTNPIRELRRSEGGPREAVP